VEWLRVLRQALVSLALEEEAVSVEAQILWCPAVFPVLVVDSARNNRAWDESDIRLALEQSDLDCALHLFWCPYNVEWGACRKFLVTRWRRDAVEEFLSNHSGGKGQNGGRNERVTHDESYICK